MWNTPSTAICEVYSTDCNMSLQKVSFELIALIFQNQLYISLEEQYAQVVEQTNTNTQQRSEVRTWTQTIVL